MTHANADAAGQEDVLGTVYRVRDADGAGEGAQRRLKTSEGFQSGRHVIGLILVAEIVGGPSRRKIFLTHTLAIQRHFIQPHRRGVEPERKGPLPWTRDVTEVGGSDLKDGDRSQPKQDAPGGPSGGWITVTPAANLAIAARPSRVVIHPGERVSMTLAVERTIQG